MLSVENNKEDGIINMIIKPVELDVHTHTIVSGHAYGTITEMAKAASEKGLKLLGITEHAKGIPGTCEDIYFGNMRVVPRTMFGIRLMLGAEINILDYEGSLSMTDKYMNYLDVRIAGIHQICYKPGTIQENTSAIIGAIKTPQIDIISHPDDSNCPLEYEAVVDAAKKYHTLLEVNNNALRMSSRKNVAENIITMLELCKQYEQPVILGSDAHYMNDIANYEQIGQVVREMDFPPELIMNYSLAQFDEYLRKNREP